MNQRLITKRKELGLTQKQMAQKIGVTTRQYQRYEAGTVIPRLNTAVAIAKTFQCDIKDILEFFSL